jgi:hypothetical protein
MKKTTIQVTEATGKALRMLKAKTRQPVGVLADIGLEFITAGIERGEFAVENGRLVKKPDFAAA